MATFYCDECHIAIGDSYSVLYPDPSLQKLMNEHDDKVHGGKGFEYSSWKD